jgi:predicted transcriptional regulator
MEDQPQLTTEHAQQQRYKTMGVRLEEDLHARLSFIAQLTDSTISDEIRRAIEARVETAQSDPDLVARAEAVRADIEREAQARQQAIAGFFGGTAVAGAQAGATSQRRRPAKSAPAERR